MCIYYKNSPKTEHLQGCELDFNKKEEIHTKKRKSPDPDSKGIKIGHIGANLTLLILQISVKKEEIL